ncbi:hypothetical protein ACG83_17235 [Frankia sp. R43]|uniref:glycosyltransferase family 87 protein n=1 Tax=Frankia sp. R43 TaxID=269536 RepID=UPI0006CA111D|nr:glycosyltransferase family 87 protein [Frankia sp. R43]KPM55074.1 hypothetical protein ACG83_17235 [Frankia sp. R43]
MTTAPGRPAGSTRPATRRQPAGPAGFVGATVTNAAGPLVLAGIIALVWVGFVAPIAHFDVDVFLRAGAAVADGRDPYPVPGTPEVYSGFSFVYPYLMSLPFVPLSGLPRADDLFIALSVVALFVACRLARAGWWTSALVLGASCTITGLQMGTLNALLFCGLVALWRLRDTPVAAGVLAALLVYSKLFLFPVVLWLVLTRRWRATVHALAALAALAAVGEVYSPVEARTYADMLGVLAREEAPDGLSLTGLLMNTGLGTGTATWAARITAAALLAGCLWSARRAGRAEADGLLFAGVIAAALVASPIVWSHYLLLLVAPLLAITRGVPGPRAGAGAGDPNRPLALFTAGSWLLVTPHLSTPMDLLVASVVLVPLVAVPFLRPLRAPRPPGEGRPRGPEHPAGLAGLPRTAARAALAAGLVAGLGAALWAVARVHGDDHRVIGAYGTLVGTIVLVAWAVRACLPTGDGPLSNLAPAPAPGPAAHAATGQAPAAASDPGPAADPAPAAGASRTRTGRMHPQ